MTLLNEMESKMSNTYKDAPYKVKLARLNPAERKGIHFHNDITLYTVIRENGKPKVITQEYVKRYVTYKQYTEHTENPVPYLSIPYIPESRAHAKETKQIWFEKETDDYFGISLRILCVRETREVVAVKETVIPFVACDMHEPLSKENDWGNLLHCHALVPVPSGSYTRYRQRRNTKTRLKNRYLGRKEALTLVKQFNASGYDDETDDFYATDYYKPNRCDWF